jgi:hypothetical protein
MAVPGVPTRECVGGVCAGGGLCGDGNATQRNRGVNAHAAGGKSCDAVSNKQIVKTNQRSTHKLI